ncbi:MAG: hypothetical protein PHE83_05915 [Opitutaceae bacterium]|nr:hypothetical protein [Opitutaceae bacterium]
MDVPKLDARRKGTATDPCCDCGITCSLICQTKGGIPCLCGFPELTAPSTPPRRFKRRTISGVMDMGKFLDAGCAGCPQANYVHLQWSNVGGTGSWIEYEFWWYSDFVRCRMTAHMTYSGGYYVSVVLNDGAGWNPSHEFVWSDGEPGGPGFDPPHVTVMEYTFSGVPSGALSVNCAATGAGSQVIYRPVIHAVHDSWDVVQDYAPGLLETPPVCVPAETDNSSRTEADTCDFPLAGGGEPGDFPVGGPLDAYPGLLDVIALTNARREWGGSEECLPGSPPYWFKALGGIVEELTEEDTELSAINRMSPGLAWSDDCGAPDYCLDCTAFWTMRGPADLCFAFRDARSKAHLSGLTVGLVYNVTVKFWRRPVGGSAGQWVLYGSAVTQIIATADEQDTDWVTVPNEAGWETWARSCFSERVV